jgi:hypothetical protein
VAQLCESRFIDTTDNMLYTMSAVYALAVVTTSRKRPAGSMTSLGVGGPVLRVPRASFSGMRDPRPQHHQHSSFSPHWLPRNANNNNNNDGAGSGSASAARRGSVGGGGSYGYGYGARSYSIGVSGGGSSSQQYDRFNGRDEQDLEVQEDEVDDDGESYERRSQEYAARQVSYSVYNSSTSSSSSSSSMPLVLVADGA